MQLGLLAASSLGLSNCATSHADDAIARQAVQVGGEADFDACYGVGRLADHLQAKAQQTNDRFPAFDRPDADANVSMSIGADDYFWLCDWSVNPKSGVKWTGIVMGNHPNNRTACSVSGSIPKRRNYVGPCSQGWMPSDYILLIAG